MAVAPLPSPPADGTVFPVPTRGIIIGTTATNIVGVH